ncbi:MAG TPA: hypothetical protein EYO58_07545 [Flavobacteriales bacterium]|nr:hypothetical protein [Flavobacteriales bacterium]
MPEEKLDVVIRELNDSRNREDARDQRLDDTLRGMTASINSLVTHMKVGRGSPETAPNGSKVSFQVMFTVMGALATVGWIMLSSTQDDVREIGGLDGRVQGIEKTLHGEQDRNTTIEVDIASIEGREIEWRRKHDREVILINTSQTIGIEQNRSVICTMWAKIYVDVNCPEIQPQPRIKP